MKKNILINIRIDPVLKSNFQDIKNDIYVVMSLFFSGGAEGVRTLAPVTRSNGLANRPLEPLGYCSKLDRLYHFYIYILYENLIFNVSVDE